MIEKKLQTQPCPACGCKMRHKARAETISYKGHERKLRTLGWWCPQCEEGVLSGEALMANELAFQELKADVDGVLA